jgi:hypothetical protein
MSDHLLNSAIPFQPLQSVLVTSLDSLSDQTFDGIAISCVIPRVRKGNVPQSMWKSCDGGSAGEAFSGFVVSV